METTNNFLSETFSSFIRNLRIETKLSMGQVARDLGITVVYYSEVEAGKKPPFPEKKVSYQKLANVLKGSADELARMAENDREKRNYVKLFDCDNETADVAVSFGRCLSNKKLNAKQLQRIRDILKDGE